MLAASVTRTNRANLLHWAAANVRDPGSPVPANLGAEPLALARDLVRRGMDAAALDAYRVGQNVAWRWWLDTAFALTSDPGELHEMLNVTSRSIGEFIDATLAGINAQMQSEREELTRGTHAERREAVALILEGAPITRRRAEARLGYALNQSHTAAVLWTDEPDGDTHSLERAVDALGQVAGTRPLNVIASAATRWVWIGGGKRLTGRGSAQRARAMPHGAGRRRPDRCRNRRLSAQSPECPHHPADARSPRIPPTHRACSPMSNWWRCSLSTLKAPTNSSPRYSASSGMQHPNYAAP